MSSFNALSNEVGKTRYSAALLRRKNVTPTLPLRLNADTSAEELENLVDLYKHDEDMLIRLARHPNLNENTMNFLANQNEKVCEVLMFSHFRVIPQQVQETIINRNEEKTLVRLIECSQELDIKLLQQLLDTNYPRVLIALSFKRSTPPEILEVLAKSDYPAVRENVACHPQTPSATILEMLDDESSGVRSAVAQSDCVKENHLMELISKDEQQDSTDADSGSAQSIMRNPNVTGRVLERIVEVYGRWFELAVFAHSACPPSLQVELYYGEWNGKSLIRKTGRSAYQNTHWKQWVVDYIKPSYPEVHIGLPFEWLENLAETIAPKRDGLMNRRGQL